MLEVDLQMEDLLHNPVYHALLTGDSAFNLGNDQVVFFDKEVSPFAGFDEKDVDGFEVLYHMLPEDRKILIARPKELQIPGEWKILAHVPGTQFVLDKYIPQTGVLQQPILLGKEHIKEMLELTALTRPGPFNTRTIEFGSYYGIFQNDKLVAMTGQRLHLPGFSEISAVCTHPDHLGNGYAGTLLRHQVELILNKNETPYLHVRADNKRAIELYERTGFKASRPMNFYFLKRS